MKITSLNINNYLGLRDLRVQDPAKVLLLAGFNGAGKSSTAEAIRHALENKFERVQYKKDLVALVHEGESSGQVLIGTDLGEYGVTLPAGDVAGDYSVLNPFLTYCLRPSAFASLKPEDRRGMLFKLMGVKINGEEISDRLVEKGANKDLIAQIRPYLSGGFDAGNKQALEFAREAKAVWRAVTGETYGDKKAETYKIPMPEIKPATATAKDLADADAEVSKIAIESGALNARMSQAKKIQAESAGRDEKLADLREKAGRFAGIQDELNKHQKALDNVQLVIAGITSSIEASEQKPLACPHCAGLVEYSVAASVPRLTRYEGETVDPQELSDAQATLLLQQTKQSHLNADIKRLTAELAAADRAAVELAALESVTPQAVDMDALNEDIKRVGDALAAANQKREQIRQELKSNDEQARIIREIEQKNADAMRSHSDVKQWDLIADALAPHGIQAELLAEAIQPFNASLQTLCTSAGWMNVEIGGDMEILVDAMPYALRSEGEQWRADAILAAAIAQNSGVNMIMLDRFDVLDMHGRNQLIGWLGKVALDQAIVMGTMKQAPAGLPSFITSVWLSGE
jgi:DNA repair exonuclease SbcCD ATPase subunit